VALWVLHTHTFEVGDTTPYLSVTSAEKQSGKTRLLEVLNLLVANPWLTSRVSAAVLVRKVAAERPTLLLDESDAAFACAEEYSEALRGILNSGHRRSGKVSLCVRQGQTIKYEDFPTFSAKAIAGIGNLPDTIADRSIPIRLKRRSPNERPARFRDRTTPAEARPIRNRVVTWAGASMEALHQAMPPALPELLSDRQQDGAEPLVMIADLIGGEWPFQARRCLVEVLHTNSTSVESVGTSLLADIKAIFDSRDSDRISSKELCGALAEIETSPWAEWSHGKRITPGKMARLLSPYGIVPDKLRVAGDSLRGYVQDDFADAWKRYLPKAPEMCLSTYSDFQNGTREQTAADAGFMRSVSKIQETAVPSENVRKATPDGPCSVVPLSKPGVRRLIRSEI
jgi:hypothetical protein